MITQYSVDELIKLFPAYSYNPALQGKISVVLKCGDKVVKAAPYFNTKKIGQGVACAVDRWVFGSNTSPRSRMLRTAGYRILRSASHLRGSAVGCLVDTPQVQYNSSWHHSIWREVCAQGTALTLLPEAVRRDLYRVILMCAGRAHSCHSQLLVTWYERKLTALQVVAQSGVADENVSQVLLDASEYALTLLHRAVLPCETTMSFHGDLRPENVLYDLSTKTCWLLDLEQSYGSRDWLSELWKSGALSGKPCEGVRANSFLLSSYCQALSGSVRDFVQTVFRTQTEILIARFELMRIEQFACYCVLCSLLGRNGYEHNIRNITVPGALMVVSLLREILARR